MLIKVVCCSPEKIKQKIICKCPTVKSIEIKEVEKPKPKEPEKPKEKPKEPEKPKEKPKETPSQCPPPHCPPPQCPPQLAYPVFRTCCTECSEGRGGGPCYSGYGRPPPCYDGYYGRPIYDSYGGGGYRSSYVSPCDYFGEENSSGCSVM